MKKVTIKKLKRAKIKKKQFVVRGVENRPRITVCRSLKHLSAQAIDDTKHRTLCGVSTTQKELQKKMGGSSCNIKTAGYIGKEMGEKLKLLKIEKIVFDRNGYLYQGNIKALADAIRETGIKF